LLPTLVARKKCAVVDGLFVLAALAAAGPPNHVEYLPTTPTRIGTAMELIGSNPCEIARELVKSIRSSATADRFPAHAAGSAVCSPAMATHWAMNAPP
jgi:hypothetical protein